MPNMVHRCDGVYTVRWRFTKHQCALYVMSSTAWEGYRPALLDRSIAESYCVR
jgi:hypothetical protein